MAEHRPDQRHLVSAIGYVFTPVTPLIVLANASTKHEPVMRKHAAQALLWALPFLLLLIAFCVAAIALLRASTLTICLLPFLFLVPFAPGGYWGRRVYLYGDVTIPVLTPLVERLFPPADPA